MCCPAYFTGNKEFSSTTRLFSSLLPKNKLSSSSLPKLHQIHKYGLGLRLQNVIILNHHPSVCSAYSCMGSYSNLRKFSEVLFLTSNFTWKTVKTSEKILHCSDSVSLLPTSILSSRSRVISSSSSGLGSVIPMGVL